MVGFGFDVHKLAAGETLILAGVSIESSIGTVAHSDGDVIYHALCDALLGAAGLGDIGEHFPDTDIKYKNQNSAFFVEEIIKLLKQKNFMLINIDITLLLEKPKILPFKAMMRENISTLCYLPNERINIKATTNEKLGFIGRNEGVAAYCVCEIVEIFQ